MKKNGVNGCIRLIFSCSVLIFAVLIAGCDSSEVGYAQDTDSIALTTLSGKSRNTRFKFNDNLSYLETSVINGTDEEVNKDESKKSGAYRIRKGYMLDVGKDYRSGFITSDRKIRVFATLDENEENETSLCLAFQRSSYMTNSSLNGDFHMNRLTWGGGAGVSFSLSKSTVTFDGRNLVNNGTENQYYQVSDDGTLRVGSDTLMDGMLGKEGEMFFSNIKDDRGNAYDFSVGIKKSSGLGTESLKGKYYACEIGKNPQKVFTQRSNLTFDGNGSYTESSADDSEQPEISGAYSVADDGSISIDGSIGTGSMTSDGKIIVVMIERAGDWRYIIARKI
ncbi:hypothetical protein [Desulforegula conservatrix]|uniref:hypothetical protein n=1 Tax=Desulforegula conservatrix TaxID=153026 RepID=UPI000426231C|nr:hypothetical protein [Desulforegula conservatrix]